LDLTDLDQLFKDKTVLDIGCGAAGKTVFYATCGVKEIYGVDKVEKYKEQAERLAKSKGVEDKFHFVIADAATLPFLRTLRHHNHERLHGACVTASKRSPRVL